jgi:hypothetical protein
MALKKQIDTKYGVTAEYHEILETYINWHQQGAIIRAGVFVNQEAKLAGSSPIAVREYSIQPSGFPFLPDRPIMADAYNYLKTLPDYADAEDVEDEE